MKLCIVETIAELENRREELQQLIDGLKRMGGGPAPAAPPVPGNGGGDGRLQIANGKDFQPVKAIKPARAGKAGAMGRGNFKDGSRAAQLERARQLVMVAASLPEPITPASLQKAAGLDSMKLANGALWRWEKREKWLKRVGVGQYARTKNFPKANGNGAAQGERLRIPGLDPESLATQLERARSELADARAGGQETLAKILKDKVEGLERDLEKEAAA